MEINSLFHAHVQSILADVRAAMREHGLDTLILHAGSPQFYESDDQEIPFRTTPHFRRFVPVESAHHILEITQTAARVIEVIPEDYWEERGGEDDFWKKEYDVEVVATPEEALAKIGAPKEIPAAILSALDTSRAVKTEYEVACIREANNLSAPAHIAARDAFMAGGSELTIHNTFVAASGTTESDLAYPSIIALNEKGATLHYRRKRSDVSHAHSFLIDAGRRYRGYAADISRTYASKDADPRFVSLIVAMDDLQQSLVKLVLPGVPFIELHHHAHMGVAKILADSGVTKIDGEDAIKSGITRAFFPHGLGHMLGIQVHDVGNRTDEGMHHPLANMYPHLRTNRTLVENMVTTIEPGIYFNDILMKRLKASDASAHVDWSVVDSLMPYGGIRIEDNIVVRATEPQNLTREFLP